jgi:hypothetical protein
LQGQNEGGGFKDEILVGSFAKEYLFHYDGLRLQMNSPNSFSMVQDNVSNEAVIDYILKRLKTKYAHVDVRGVFTYVSRLSQGCFCDSSTLEAELFANISLLSANEKVHSLISAWRNHCGSYPEKGLAMVFQTCCALLDMGEFKMAEEIRLEASFLKELSFKIWSQEEPPLMAIRALLEAVGLIALLSSRKTFGLDCKLEMHKKKQYLHLNIMGTHLLLPFLTYNTLTVLKEAMNTSALPFLQKSFNAFMPEVIDFLPDLSEEKAGALSINLSDFDMIDGRWPQLREICLRLKKEFSFKPQVEVSHQPHVEEVAPTSVVNEPVKSTAQGLCVIS